MNQVNPARRVVHVFLLALLPTVAIANVEESSPETITIEVADQINVQALVFRPAKDGPARETAVILLHGGGWRWGEAEWMAARGRHLAELGFPAISLDYRLAVDGVTPIDSAHDACRAIQWLRESSAFFGTDIRRVVAYGMSAGGQLAAATVTVGCPGVGDAGEADALLLWSPALAVEKDGWFQRLLGEAARAEDWSPNTNLHDDLPPTAIVHGEKDTLTPLAGSKVFCAGVERANSECAMFVYPGVGHLLTRNLENQESDFDVDPAMLEDAIGKLAGFLIEFDSTARSSR